MSDQELLRYRLGCKDMCTRKNFEKPTHLLEQQFALPLDVLGIHDFRETPLESRATISPSKMALCALGPARASLTRLQSSCTCFGGERPDGSGHPPRTSEIGTRRASVSKSHAGSSKGSRDLASLAGVIVGSTRFFYHGQPNPARLTALSLFVFQAILTLTKF